MTDLKVDIDADATRFEREVTRAQRAMWKFDNQVKQTNKSSTAFDKRVNREASQRFERQAQAMGTLGRGVTAFGAATVAGLGLAAKAAVDWETAWTGVTKTVDATPAQLATLQSGLRQLATELPASHQEIAAVAEAAGQLGVSTGGITEFTRTMINLGETTNLSAEEAATTLARFANITGTSEDQISNLGSTLVGLGNNFATTEAEIAAMGQRLAGAGVQAGMTEGDILGLAAAASSVGIEAEAGGTALSMTMTRIGTAVDEGGAKLELFAKLAGMSSAQFATAWREDAGSAMTAVVTGMSDTSSMGMSLNAVLDELGIKGIREADTMRRLSSAHETLNGAMDMGNTAFEENNALQAEAAKRYETTQAKLQIARNGITDAAISLGETFLPMIAGAAQGVADFAQAFSELPAPVMKVAAVLGSAAGAAGLLGGGMLMMAPKILAAKTMLADLTATSPRAAAGLSRVGSAGRRAGGLLMGVGKAAVPILAVVTALELLEQATADAGVGAEEMSNRLLAARQGAGEIADIFKGVDTEWFLRDSMDLSALGDVPQTADDWRALLNELEATSSGFGKVQRSIGGLIGLDADLKEMEQRFQSAGEAMAAMAQTDVGAAQESFKQLVDAAGGGEEVTRQLLDQMPAYEEALNGIANEQKLALDGTSILAAATGELDLSQGQATGSAEELAAAQAETAAAEQEAQQAADDRKQAIDDLVSSLNAQRDAERAVSGEMLSAREAQRSLEDAIDSANAALKDNGATLDLNTKKGRENQDALDGIAAAGLDYVDALREQGASQGKIDEALNRTRKQFLDVAESMGLGEKKAKELARELGLMPDAEIKVDADTLPARRKGESERDYLNRLRAEVTVLADTTLAREEGESTGDYIDRLRATIEVDGGTAPARRAGESAQKYIDRLKSIIGVNSDTVPARREGESARDYIKRLKGAVIKVDADTSDAKEKVKDLRKQVLKLPNKTITVTTDTRVTGPGMTTGGLPWGSGDGEGAGWSGGTPRGVGQMSAAVRSMDPSARITSGYRPGAITATGYPSYHGMGRAIDIVSSNMGRTWDMLARAFGSRAKELYYTPRGFIRNGRMTNNVAAVTRRTHYSHVHLALNRGGRVQGPGTGTSDDIPAWLSNGEHVLTAADVRKLGGQEKVYQLRAAIQAGRLNLDPEPTFASGGAVRSARRSLDSARRELARARRARRDAKKDGARDRAQRRVDRAEDRVQGARDRLGRLRVERRDLYVDLRRRNIREQVTSGSGVSVVDEMLELVRSGDLTKRQGRRLKNRARDAESDLKRLYRQAERLDKRLEKAQERVEDLKGIRDEVANTFRGGFTLAGAATTNPWTGKEEFSGKGMLAAAREYAGKAKRLAGKLRTLRGRGFAGVILQEVANAGVEQGGAMADALLQMGAGDRRDLNRQYAEIARLGNTAGQTVTEGFYKGGLAAADGLVRGLKRNQSKVERQIMKVAKGMENALKKALGIRSPSRVFHDLGMQTGKGMELGLVDSAGGVQRAAERLVSVPAPGVPVNPAGGGAQNLDVGEMAGAFASALNGQEMTLLVDGHPVRGIVRTEVGAMARTAGSTLRGGRR